MQPVAGSSSATFVVATFRPGRQKKRGLTFHEPVRFVVHEHATFAGPLTRRGFQTCTHIARQLDTEMANDWDRIVKENWHGAAIILEEECRRYTL
jgi:hypothetical protein